MDHAPKPPLPADRQPGFGPREIDPPIVEGYQPDLSRDREALVADQPKTDTMEAADTPAVEEQQDSNLDQASVSSPGNAMSGPQAGLHEPDPLHPADMPADEPGAFEKVGIQPVVSRPD